VVIWASAAFAGYESFRKLIAHGHATHVGAGIAGAVILAQSAAAPCKAMAP
jgi:hypothetical protein